MALRRDLVAVVICTMSFGSSFVGCSGPSISPQMAVPVVPIAKRQASRPMAEKAFVSLDQLKDSRSENAIAIVRETKAEPTGDILTEVRSALESTLSNAGVSVSDSAPIMISAEVKKWLASGVSSGVKSDAELRLQVFDPANKLIYSGTYRGNAVTQQSGMKDQEVRENLGTAMSEAMAQIVSDKKLMQILSSF